SLVSGYRRCVLTPNVAELGRIAGAVGLQLPGGMGDHWLQHAPRVAEAFKGPVVLAKGGVDLICAAAAAAATDTDTNTDTSSSPASGTAVQQQQQPQPQRGQEGQVQGRLQQLQQHLQPAGEGMGAAAGTETHGSAEPQLLLRCSDPGSLRRCGGQGDVLAGTIAAFLCWAAKHQQQQQQQQRLQHQPQPQEQEQPASGSDPSQQQGQQHAPASSTAPAFSTAAAAADPLLD
ncbi:hypothetical protein Agub_g6836, partial [Astrephomene gubernaculifera]